MSTTAIIVLAVVALLAWGVLLDAVKDALAIRVKAFACPCRDLHSMTLTPGATFELPPGTKLSAGAESDRKVVSITEVPIQVEGDPNFTYMFSTEGTVVRKAFADTAGFPAELQADVERVPRMSERELDGLYQDLAKVGRLRASGSPHELARAKELHALVVEQAAAPARKGH